MATPNVCPRCGFTNQPGWTFCTNCGSPLSPSGGAWAAPPSPGVPAPGQPPAAPYPAYPGYPPPIYGPPPWEAERQKQIQRTKTGVLLLLVGSLINWIPFIGGLGGLLVLIGAILVIVGRKAFGAEHRRNVVISILLYVVGLIAIVSAVAIVFFTALTGIPQGASRPVVAAALQSAITTSLYVVVAGGIIIGVARVLFTYALQDRLGKILLWAAYGATIGILIALVILALPFVPAVADDLARQVTTGVTNFDATRLSALLDGQTTGTAILNVVPSLLYAAAAYLAWDRINKGVIPAQAAPPGMPGTMPPMSPPAPPINPA